MEAKSIIERISRRPESNGFLGDEAAMEVHDLGSEDTTEKRCYIDEIFEKGNVVVFFPDALDEVHQQGYENCEHCIGKRSHRLITKLIIDE